ncbi:MAG: sensor histidine kinase [bacterium]
MTVPPAPQLDLAARLALKLRAARTEVVRRWLDRIVARVSISANSVFPTDELLDHIPILIEGIADYLDGTGAPLDGDVPVAAKAMELGALRHSQGFDAYEIMKEYELLAGVLYTFLREALDDMGPAQPAEVAYAWQRIAEVTERIRQATVMHFLRISAEQVRQREERLRRFNRLVSHELKNRIGAIRGASALLAEPWIDAAQSDQFHGIIAKNAEGLQRVVENLIALSRLDGDARQQRNILLPQAAAEVVRQLRDAAELNDVAVRLSADLPNVEVDAAAVELCLTNYISNAIKYSDRSTVPRWVEISGELVVATATRSGELQVRVRDNGLGVPQDARSRLFEQFYRVEHHAIAGIEGTGLGLNIVQDTVVSLGGRVWAEFPEAGGSIFGFSLPSRREEDAAAAGTRRDVSETPTEGVPNIT